MKNDFRTNKELITTVQNKMTALNNNIVNSDYIEEKSGNLRVSQISNVSKSELTTCWITSSRINMRLGFKSALYLLNPTLIDNSSLRKITDNENKLSFKSLEEFITFTDTMQSVVTEKKEEKKATSKKRTTKKSETKTA